MSRNPHQLPSPNLNKLRVSYTLNDSSRQKLSLTPNILIGSQCCSSLDIFYQHPKTVANVKLFYQKIEDEDDCLMEINRETPLFLPKNQTFSDELHAFDLTWRNYIPSASQLCCCFKDRGIQLEDDDPLIDPPYYNDQTLYRGEALENYVDHSPRDWEFESVLGQNDLPQFVTRNPFGTSSLKKKKTHKKNKNRREQPAVMDTDVEEGDFAGYSIGNQQDEEYYNDNDDAEFLGDDRIANLAYNRYSSQLMDQYGEELCQGHVQGPIEQEMQTPPPPQEFYAARSIPNVEFVDDQHENHEDYEERADLAQTEPSSHQHQSKPFVSIEAAQALLSNKLDDLTEKLVSIKNNIMHLRPQSPQEENRHQNKQEFDRTTLHTLCPEESEESHSVSDLDSIASEALNVYESTSNETNTNTHSSMARRCSAGDELHIPSLVDNTPFASEQHPFSYFTDDSTSSPSHQEISIGQQESNVNNNDGINVQSVLNIGRKWLGV
ncbi:hypothetical protein [Parasitella parasitica]|uniref:Uncharacterized protein n=1 Tax=Parasitella parasitica TaxID=35722 RepID=A0A0B7NBT8_9FUNG|nr:hypothetical protein [Parasitella parasitica]